jgi:acetoin:2,6-dichlorophenolindophenol oxidoreductase subunit beta
MCKDFYMQPSHSDLSRRSVLESLNEGLHQAFSADARVIILGEDILDPYGGAFKVTRGLSTAYPERVWSTPISEAGIVGIAGGMAMRGLLPVVEIMFGDFLTLAADQIINHIVKFPWMYSGGRASVGGSAPLGRKSPAEQVTIPLVIRTPMGGRRGYGPTHSQTLEKLFLGIPGLKVIAPSHLIDHAENSPGRLLAQAILRDQGPVLFIENKLQYLLAVENLSASVEFELITDPPTAGASEAQLPVYPTYTLKLSGAPPARLTLAAYGYMAELARQALLRLAYEYEIFCELVVPTQLAPFRLEVLFKSSSRTGRLLAIEEGNLTMGWGAEVLARVVEAAGKRTLLASRIAALDLPVPASGLLEAAVLPGVDQIVAKVLEMFNNR